MRRIIKWVRLVSWLFSYRKVVLFDHELFKGITWLYFSQVIMTSSEYEKINTDLHLFAKKLLPFRLKEEYKFTRVGSKNDGGYVLVDDLNYPIISIGIGSNSEFDHAMCGRNVKVYQFDHTIDLKDKCCASTEFYKIGLTHSKSHNSKNFLTLDEITRKCNVRENASAILKVDIEGGEWKVFSDPNVVNTLMTFRQIVFEGHNTQNIMNKDFRLEIIQALTNLNKNFAVVNYHSNNNLPGLHILGLFLPQTFELTMARRDLYVSEINEYQLPEANAANNPGRYETVEHLSSLRNFIGVYE
jgi:hypothetical protein